MNKQQRKVWDVPAALCLVGITAAGAAGYLLGQDAGVRDSMERQQQAVQAVMGEVESMMRQRLDWREADLESRERAVESWERALQQREDAMFSVENWSGGDGAVVVP